MLVVLLYDDIETFFFCSDAFLIVIFQLKMAYWFENNSTTPSPAKLLYLRFSDGTAGEVVNPNKTREEVEKESSHSHDLYVVSHHDYYVSEPYDRKLVTLLKKVIFNAYVIASSHSRAQRRKPTLCLQRFTS